MTEKKSLNTNLHESKLLKKRSDVQNTTFRIQKVSSNVSNPPSTGNRVNWFDEKSQTPLIDQYARNLTSFLDVLADGKVDGSEIKSQEARVLDLMKQIESQLDDALHAKVTALLCELTAYDLMQTLYQMQQARPQTAFRG